MGTQAVIGYRVVALGFEKEGSMQIMPLSNGDENGLHPVCKRTEHGYNMQSEIGEFLMMEFPDMQCLTDPPNSSPCESGYEQKTGTTNGWYRINGNGGGDAQLNCGECAQLCNDQGDACLAYECSDTTNRCNLLSFTYPQLSEARDHYYFCTKQSTMNLPCASGYIRKEGSTDGYHFINGHYDVGGGRQVADCQECADNCSNFAECQTYECSPHYTMCSLIDFTKEPDTEPYFDFHWCSKP